MNKELEQYYREMFQLFRTDGWTTLLLDLKTNLETIDSIEHAKGLEDLFFRKGQLNIIGTLMNLEETTLNSFEQLDNPQEDEQDYDV
jgi:hypothetical protein|tara:strand:- start:344 stop:604 length:261 start_codon:yes stop_codon:yes gene_type:complete